MTRTFYIIIIIFTIVLIGASILLIFFSRQNVKEETSTKQYIIGLVSYGGGHTAVIDGFKAGMSELQYKQGENIRYLDIDAQGDEEKVRLAVLGFIQDKANAIYTVSTPVTKVALDTAPSVPIVFNIVSDPVGAQIAKSLQSSGTNATGCSNAVAQTGAKRLEILKSILPDAKKIVILYDPSNSFSIDALSVLNEVAPLFGLELDLIEIESSESVIIAMENMQQDEYDAFFHLGEAKVSGARDSVIRLANKIKLPTFAHAESFAENGMLVSFGPSWFELGRQCAITMDKVLHGIAPSSIPIQLPLKFEFVVNLKTADELGIKLNRETQSRVDKFIR
jgi:putative tryptophan/tyrosine transport system substrate-binding protein